jgi:hypothetical protein
MNKRIIGSMESSPLVNIAVLIIIFAGAIYAKSIITPFLLNQTQQVHLTTFEKIKII